MTAVKLQNCKRNPAKSRHGFVKASNESSAI